MIKLCRVFSPLQILIILLLKQFSKNFLAVCGLALCCIFRHPTRTRALLLVSLYLDPSINKTSPHWSIFHSTRLLQKIMVSQLYLMREVYALKFEYISAALNEDPHCSCCVSNSISYQIMVSMFCFCPFSWMKSSSNNYAKISICSPMFCLSRL